MHLPSEHGLFYLGEANPSDGNDHAATDMVVASGQVTSGARTNMPYVSGEASPVGAGAASSDRERL